MLKRASIRIVCVYEERLLSARNEMEIPASSFAKPKKQGEGEASLDIGRIGSFVKMIRRCQVSRLGLPREAQVDYEIDIKTEEPSEKTLMFLSVWHPPRPQDLISRRLELLQTSDGFLAAHHCSHRAAVPSDGTSCLLYLRVFYRFSSIVMNALNVFKSPTTKCGWPRFSPVVACERVN